MTTVKCARRTKRGRRPEGGTTGKKDRICTSDGLNSHDGLPDTGMFGLTHTTKRRTVGRILWRADNH